MGLKRYIPIQAYHTELSIIQSFTALYADLTIIIYILITPNACNIEATSIMTISIGATYLITIVNKFLSLNFTPFVSTSSITALGFITYPTNMHVKKATIGIRTELDIKSNKSRNCIPRNVIIESGP